MNQDLQLVSQSENQEVLGPFGRSFIGDFPTKGTLCIIVLAILMSAWISGGLLSFLLLSIISVYLAIYFCYNYIEPHFNSRIGVEREKRLSRITKDPNHLAMGDIGRLLHGYGKSAVGQVWDLSGEVHLAELFGNKTEQKELPIGNWELESKFKTWLKISLIWIANFVTLYAVLFGTLLLIWSLDIQSIDLTIWSSAIVQFLILFIILLIVLFLEDNIGYLSSLFVVPDIKKSTLLVILVSILDFILVILVYTWLYDLIVGSQADEAFFFEASSANDPLILLLVFISFAIAAPLVEEMIFRGYVLDKLRNVHSDTFAIIYTGILFGLLHWDPIFGFWDLYQTGAATIGGFLYAWLRIKTGSLWPSIACHSIWNGTIFFLEFVL
ncbi:MAG: CPBP family intramembrane metalloprotease [Candidatus Poseidoniales archaeon]|nr:CPBP family intramembrane metalloprotease [Candidatus Poseidoniales archaeon]